MISLKNIHYPSYGKKRKRKKENLKRKDVHQKRNREGKEFLVQKEQSSLAQITIQQERKGKKENQKENQNKNQKENQKFIDY